MYMLRTYNTWCTSVPAPSFPDPPPWTHANLSILIGINYQMDFDYRYGSSTLFPLALWYSCNGSVPTVRSTVHLLAVPDARLLAFGRGQNPRRSFISGKTAKKNEILEEQIFLTRIEPRSKAISYLHYLRLSQAGYRDSIHLNFSCYRSKITSYGNLGKRFSGWRTKAEDRDPAEAKR